MSQESVFNKDYFLDNVDERELKDYSVRVESDQLEQLKKLGLIIDKGEVESN